MPMASGEPSSVERGRGGVEVGLRAGQHGDASAVGGEAVGRGAAHAGGAAGDEDGGAVESEIHALRSSFSAGGYRRAVYSRSARAIERSSIPGAVSPSHV